jgi:hypothetical protein
MRHASRGWYDINNHGQKTEPHPTPNKGQRLSYRAWHVDRPVLPRTLIFGIRIHVNPKEIGRPESSTSSQSLAPLCYSEPDVQRNCLERLRLGRALAAAADAVNTAKREFESAKAKKAETTNLEDLADLLKGARILSPLGGLLAPWIPAGGRCGPVAPVVRYDVLHDEARTS